MKFDRFFLLHESRASNITEEEFFAFYEHNCKQFDPTKNRLYRNVKNKEWSFVNPKNHERNSASYSAGDSESNFIQWTIEYLPSWKDYPKRSQSIICATSASVAAGYSGNTHFVIPFDGATLGICPHNDFFNCFVESVPDLNRRIGRTLRKVDPNTKFGDVSGFIDNLTRDQYLKLVKTLNYRLFDNNTMQQKQIDRIGGNGRAKYNVELIQKQIEENFWPTLQKILDPQSNKFEKIPVSQYDDKKYTLDSKEVWFSHPAILVEIATVEIILKQHNVEYTTKADMLPKYINFLRQRYARTNNPTTPFKNHEITRPAPEPIEQI